MSDEPIEVGVLVVCHNGRQYLESCLSSILSAADRRLLLHVVVVDNASTDGSLASIEKRLPHISWLILPENRGYAGGANYGCNALLDTHPDIQYLCLLNQDTIIDPEFLQRGVAYLEAHPQTGCVQPKLMLDADRSRFNTAGNRSHFLGFGFMTGFEERDAGQYDRDDCIDFASGAALLTRADLVRRVGLFDSEFFMYLEDAEFSWKLRQIGSDIRRLPLGIVFHDYRFDGSLRHYFHLEKNRLWLLCVYYKWQTLLLLLPAILLMELGQLGFAAVRGLLAERFRVYTDLLGKSQRKRLWKKRREVQARRSIGDREFLRTHTGSIDFLPIRNPLVRYVANPLFAAYWSVARRLLFW